MYKELTSVGVYMLIYTPWNFFDVWLHHSIYIYIPMRGRIKGFYWGISKIYHGV